MFLKMMCYVRTQATVSLSKKLQRHISFGRGTVGERAAKEGELRVFIVAGEVSGDSIGSKLMSSLKQLSPVPTRFVGVGGSMMSKHGLKSLFPMEDISVMGIWELLPHLYKIRVKLKETIEAATRFQPHVVVTVDSKGFSFRFLKQLRARYNQKNLDSPLHFHYVAPSFWAWRGGEARLIGLAKFVDHIFCILPGEQEVCRSKGLEATFVGHPVLEDISELNGGEITLPPVRKMEGNCVDFRSKYGVPSGATIVTVLPGSRLQEVKLMMSIFKDTMKLLKDSYPELLTVIHVASNEHVRNYISDVIIKWPVPTILIPGGSSRLKYDAFGASKVALCTSGTVAVELQLACLPCIVVYRAHIITEWFIRFKAKIPYISLPNILLCSDIIPEVLFGACKPTKLASLLRELIENKGLQEKQLVEAEKVIRLLQPSQIKSYGILGKNLARCSPSMIASSTILHHAIPCSLIHRNAYCTRHLCKRVCSQD